MSTCNSCRLFNSCYASDLSRNELDDYESSIIQREAKAGEVLFNEEQRAKNGYVLVKGIVKLKHQHQFEIPIIQQIGQVGDFLGFESVLKDAYYSTTAVALSDIQYCVVPKQTIEHVMTNNKAACSRITQKIINTFERIYEDAIIRILGSLEAKIAQSILSLSNEEGKVMASKRNIALMNGVSRESVSRVIKRFSDLELIESNQRTIIIKDAKELNRLTDNLKRK